MMKVYLIRHSMTEGNIQKRYIGKTDEKLCGEGIRLLRERDYPQAERVYSSPMLRCLQTAGIIYPGQGAVVISQLSECDFGIFENKNYQELKECMQYQEWIDSGGTLPFPEGESVKAFKKRSLQGFETAIGECIRQNLPSAAFVIHGGTIMCIMEKYAVPHQDYYDYQLENGEGYELTILNVPACGGWICDGPHTGGSGVAVSSGQDHGTPDYAGRKNYKRLSFRE